MTPSVEWIDQVALRVTCSYETFAQQLQESNPQLSWVVSSYRTRAFPLRVFLSLRTGQEPEAEDVVVCVDCVSQPAGIAVQIDVCRDGGELLDEGQEMAVSEVGPDSLDLVAAGVDAFLRDASAAVLGHLQEPSRSSAS